MKEFLNPDQGYKLVRCEVGRTAVPENWFEIPEGAFSLTKCEYTFLFWNHDQSMCMNPEIEICFRKYNYDGHAGYFKLNNHTMNKHILWQREKVEGKNPEDPINNPSHYNSHPSGIQCIEVTRHHDFAIGNAIKYLWRAGLKDSDNEVQDLEKAVWYIQDKIKQLKGGV